MANLSLYALVCLCYIVHYARADGGGGGTGGGVVAACINGADQVETVSGLKRIDQLKIGDHVAVENNKFEPIISFLHRDQTKNAQGFHFTTATGKTLTLSDEHLVFVAPNRKAVLAKNVKVGQSFYLVKDGSYGEETVAKVERSELEGRYSPLTPSGMILVNDLLVSCYSQIEDHHLMHRIVNWLMPITSSESVFGTEGSLNNADGMHWLGEALWHHLRHWFIAGESH